MKYATIIFGIKKSLKDDLLLLAYWNLRDSLKGLIQRYAQQFVLP